MTGRQRHTGLEGREGSFRKTRNLRILSLFLLRTQCLAYVPFKSAVTKEGPRSIFYFLIGVGTVVVRVRLVICTEQMPLHTKIIGAPQKIAANHLRRRAEVVVAHRTFIAGTILVIREGSF